MAMEVSADVLRLILDMGDSDKEVDKVRLALEELEKTGTKVGTALEGMGDAAGGAAGQKSAGGRGVLGVSYAFQDFVSVISQGGENALPRAMMAITNNFDQMAMAAGASVATAAKLSFAFTGFVALLPTVLPALKSLWEAIAGPPEVKEGIDKLEDRINKLKERLESVRKAATGEAGAEKEVEKALAMAGPDLVGQVARAIGVSGRGATAEQVADETLRKSAAMTEETITRMARVAAMPMEGVPGVPEAETRARLQAERAGAEAEIRRRINEANLADATQRVDNARQGGAEQQRQILRMAQRQPGQFAPQFASRLQSAMMRSDLHQKAIDEYSEQGAKDANAAMKARAQRDDDLREGARAGEALMRREEAENLRLDRKEKADAKKALDTEMDDTKRDIRLMRQRQQMADPLAAMDRARREEAQWRQRQQFMDPFGAAMQQAQERQQEDILRNQARWATGMMGRMNGLNQMGNFWNGMAGQFQQHNTPMMSQGWFGG